MTKEQPLFSEWNALWPTHKSDSLKNIWIKWYFCKFYKISDSLTPSFVKSYVSFGQIAHQKWATVSESLTKNERECVNCSPNMSKLGNRSLLSKSLFLLQKISGWLKKTLSEFPTLRTTIYMSFLKTQNQPTLLYKGVRYCTNLVYNKSACTWSTDRYPVIEKLFPLLYKQWFTNSIVCYCSLAM